MTPILSQDKSQGPRNSSEGSARLACVSLWTLLVLSALLTPLHPRGLLCYPSSLPSVLPPGETPPHLPRLLPSILLLLILCSAQFKMETILPNSIFTSLIYLSLYSLWISINNWLVYCAYHLFYPSCNGNTICTGIFVCFSSTRNIISIQWTLTEKIKTVQGNDLNSVKSVFLCKQH